MTEPSVSPSRPSSRPLSHDDLVEDLRVLRERGLVRIRETPLAALTEAAGIHLATDEPSRFAVERLLADAVSGLGGGSLETAAAYTFGLVQGTRDWQAADRRRQAARVYGVSVERFRKHQERVVLAQVAEQILGLCERRERPAPTRARYVARSQVLLDAAGDVRVTVHARPIEQLTGIDVLVSPENVYMEMSKTFRSSVSAALRRAGASRGAAGEMVEDTVQLELLRWMGRHARAGLPVAPGTVAATGPGGLAANGVRRIYHVAVAVPAVGRDAYAVEPGSVSEAVHRVFRLATAEREDFSPPLSSLCFPLIGTGRGGLSLETGLYWLWTAIAESLGRHPRWAIHLSVPRPDVTERVLEILSGHGARRL
ncbi:hypothetical protein [Streptosporangium sp. NPDC051022]|uniref:hypothetical protein n=1 Tax=Streptosporangium sp. NPDC051022 TaxID=3155752 RepID=UPI0034376E7D